MSSVLDQTPVLPQNTLEWKEFLEYGASISFSFLTGMLLGGIAYTHRNRFRTGEQSKALRSLLAQIGSGKLSPDSLQQLIKKLESLGSATIALGTTAMSIYTGLKSVM